MPDRKQYCFSQTDHEKGIHDFSSRARQGDLVELIFCGGVFYNARKRTFKRHYPFQDYGRDHCIGPINRASGYVTATNGLTGVRLTSTLPGKELSDLVEWNCIKKYFVFRRSKEAVEQAVQKNF